MADTALCKQTLKSGHAATAPLAARVRFRKRAGLAGQFQQLIDRERDQAEHEMCHDFAGFSNTNEASAEFIFEPL